MGDVIENFKHWTSSKDEEYLKNLKRYVNNMDEDYMNIFMDENRNINWKALISDFLSNTEKSSIIKISGIRSLKIEDEIYDFPSIKSEDLPEDWDF